MKRIMILAGLFSAGVAMGKTSTPVGWTDDYDGALKQAAVEKKLVLADFSGSDWCGWCKRLDKEVFDTEAFRRDATNRFVLLMVDSPRDKSLLSEQAKKRNPELAKKYKVQGFPTVLVLDEKGEVVVKTGYKAGGPEKYLKLLDTEVKYGPEIAKYIKPIEAVLNEPNTAVQKEMAVISKRIEKQHPAPKGESAADRKKRTAAVRDECRRAFFAEVADKQIPAVEASIEKAKGMKVPDFLADKKDDLIWGAERQLKYLKKAKADFDKKK